MLDFTDKNRAVQSPYESHRNKEQFYILTNPSQKVGQSSEVIESVTHAGGCLKPKLRV
jgi:hypothetical protein